MTMTKDNNHKITEEATKIKVALFKEHGDRFFSKLVLWEALRMLEQDIKEMTQ